MKKAVRHHSDVCERCGARREIVAWPRYSSFNATVPGACPRKGACVTTLAKAAGCKVVLDLQEIKP